MPFLATRIAEASQVVWDYHYLHHKIEYAADFLAKVDGVLVFCSSDISVAHEAARLWLALVEASGKQGGDGREGGKEELPFPLFGGGTGTGMHSGANLMGWTRAEAEMLCEEAGRIISEAKARGNSAMAPAHERAVFFLLRHRDYRW